MSTLTQLSDAELDAVTGGFLNTNIAFTAVYQAAANVNESVLSLVSQENTQVVAVTQIS